LVGGWYLRLIYRASGISATATERDHRSGKGLCTTERDHRSGKGFCATESAVITGVVKGFSQQRVIDHRI
jgi:hypothetical protein